MKALENDVPFHLHVILRFQPLVCQGVGGKMMWWSKEFSSKRCHHFSNPQNDYLSKRFFPKNAMIYLAKLTDRNWSHKNFRIHVVGIPWNNNLPSGNFKSSGQIKKCHQPICLWNKGISLPQLPFGVRSREVALIWPALPILVENAIKKNYQFDHITSQISQRTTIGMYILGNSPNLFYQKKKNTLDVWEEKWLPQIQIVSVFA